MRIGVIGAGAVGGYFGGRLAQAGRQVGFVARGETLEALRRDGLRVQSVDGDFHLQVAAAETPAGLLEHWAGPPDLWIIAVKSRDTEAAGAVAASAMTGSTAVLSLQNGIENEAILARIVGSRQVVGGVTYIASERVGPNRIVHSSNGWLRIGELNGRPSGRTAAIAEAFRTAGIRCEVSDDILRAKWQKLLWNAVFNPVNALTGRPLTEVLQDPVLYDACRRAVEEVAAVARAEGIRMDDEDVTRTLRQGQAFGARTSMLQDRSAGRPLETDALTGVVLRRGRRRGVESPVVAMLDGLCRALSETPSGPS